MSIFDEIVPHYMAKLMADFDCTAEDAAVVFGNAGHESLGFTKLQEIKPTVPGSRGGYGWFQWTGPRRRAYEAYCRRNTLDPEAPDSNYAFLFVELTTTEKRAMPEVRAAGTLYAKTKAFERAFERAGVKHHASRHRWAKRALAAYHDNPPGTNTQPSAEPARPSGGFFHALFNLLRRLFK